MRPFVVSALLLAVVAAACGEAQMVETSTDRVHLDVLFEPEPLVSGHPATFGLQMTNVSDERVVFEFDTTQRGDVRLSAPAGVEVYRWAERRAFAHEPHQVVLMPGERVTLPLDESPLPVAPGTYDVLATTTGAPKLRVVRAKVSVDAPGTAAGDATPSTSEATAGPGP